MSRDALAAVAQFSAARGPALLVAFRIADHTNRFGWSWPSVALLVDETGFSKNTVLRSIEALAELGELHRETGRNRGGNRYRLRLAGIPGSDLEESPDARETVPPGDRSQAVDNVRNGAIRTPERSQIGAGTVPRWDPNLRNRVEPAPGARHSSRDLCQPGCPDCGGSGWTEVEGGVVPCRFRP